jgi:Domain of unknown function (DUF222)
MAAIAAYAARHCGSGPADEFAPVELACELHLTPQSAAEQMGYAGMVAARLPETFAALGAGRIHPVHLRIIEDETRFLSDQDAAAADAVLAGQAPGLTFGELRYAARKLVLKLDPDAARKRKEAARGEAHVRPFREHSGNAGWWPGSCPPMRCWRPGSMWSSGRWTCARPGCPAPCGSCACAPRMRSAWRVAMAVPGTRRRLRATVLIVAG